MAKKIKAIKQINLLKNIVSEAEIQAEKLSINCNPNQRKNILVSGLEQYADKIKGKKTQLKPHDPMYKMMTLFEFDNALLVCGGFKEEYRSLLSDLTSKLQAEYQCKTVSEKATAHLTAQNYVRTIQIQSYIFMLLHRDTYTDMTTRRLAILEKAYDRANRQYLLSIQALQQFRQPPINVRLFTRNAMIGQYQQMVNEGIDQYIDLKENINAK